MGVERRQFLMSQTQRQRGKLGSASLFFAKFVQSEDSLSILPTAKWRTCCWISRTISNLTKSILTLGHLNSTTDFHVQFACSVPQSELLLNISVTPSVASSRE